MFVGAPITIENAFEVEIFGSLSLRPKRTTLHFDAQLGRRVNRATHARPFVNARSWLTRDIRECLGLVVYVFELDLVISCEQI